MADIRVSPEHVAALYAKHLHSEEPRRRRGVHEIEELGHLYVFGTHVGDPEREATTFVTHLAAAAGVGLHDCDVLAVRVHRPGGSRRGTWLVLTDASAALMDLMVLIGQLNCELHGYPPMQTSGVDA